MSYESFGLDNFIKLFRKVSYNSLAKNVKECIPLFFDLNLFDCFCLKFVIYFPELDKISPSLFERRIILCLKECNCEVYNISPIQRVRMILFEHFCSSEELCVCVCVCVGVCVCVWGGGGVIPPVSFTLISQKTVKAVTPLILQHSLTFYKRLSCYIWYP